MKILLVTFQQGYAGSALSTFYLAKGLSERGHRIFLAAPPDSVLCGWARDTNIMFLPLSKGHKYFDADTISKLRAIIRRENIKIVNSQSSRDRYALGMIKFFFPEQFILVHTRRQRVNSTGFFLQNWFYNRTADCMVAVSNGVKNSLLKLGLGKGKIVVINNGTPTDKYELMDLARVESYRKRYGLSQHDTVIGCVARKKKQEQLLEALQYLPQDLKVLFVGITEEDLAEEIKKHKPRQQLLFAGKLSGEEALYHYPLFSVKVLPSIIEGLSQALLEAMALEVPVIATDACGNPDLIDNGQNGFLFDNGDDRQLAAIIDQVLNMNREELKRITNKAQDTALIDHNIEKVIDSYEILFRKLEGQ